MVKRPLSKQWEQNIAFFEPSALVPPPRASSIAASRTTGSS
jgi:hypothetical protein